MKINHGKRTPSSPLKFEDGHLYTNRSQSIGQVWYCVCGRLVNMPTGNTSDLASHVDPAGWVDVTDDYTLVHNSVLGGKHGA